MGFFHPLIVILDENVSLLALELLLHFSGILSVDYLISILSKANGALHTTEERSEMMQRRKLKTRNDRRKRTVPPF